MSFGKLLLKTYFFSLLLSIILLYAFALLRKVDDDSHIIPLIFVGSIFLNLLIAVVTIPGILIARKLKNQNSNPLVAYFLTPLAILICMIFSKLQNGDMQFYLIIVLSFITVLGFFFFRGTAFNTMNTKAERTQGLD